MIGKEGLTVMLTLRTFALSLAQNGTLSVIDRKKNLVKLAGGEYIALERLECVFVVLPHLSPLSI
jgi:long-chain acyl-CoA synthetase